MTLKVLLLMMDIELHILVTQGYHLAAFIFDLVVDILAIAVRKSESIEGILLNGDVVNTFIICGRHILLFKK